ncbi:MAG: PAS domain S-box protein [Bacteroidetes bacterium]|nr:PAS domain S-box protein [Bacteroidota bacterium]
MNTKHVRKKKKIKVENHEQAFIGPAVNSGKVNRKQFLETWTESPELYRFLFNNINDAIFVSVRDEENILPGKFTLVSDIACQRLGYTRDELLQMTPLDISEPLATIPGTLESLTKEGQQIHEEILVAKDGRKIPVEVSTRLFQLDGQEMNLSIARDISERKQAENKLKLQSTALNAAANAIVITDKDGTIQWVNAAWSRLTGYSYEESLGKNPRILKSGVQDASYYENLWSILSEGKVWHGELVNKRKDGSFYSEEQTITPVYNDNGDLTHFIAIKQDVSERKTMMEKLRQLSIYDSLTGLYNRGFFEAEMSRLEQQKNFPVSIIIGDIDGLKTINDRDGHAAGDALIQRGAQVLKNAFRSADIVARIGGDEFAVILPQADELTAKEALLRLRHILDAHNRSYQNNPLSISLGVSTTKGTSTLLEVLREADANMYREKREHYRD